MKFDRRNRKVFPDYPPDGEPPLSRREREDMEEDEAEHKEGLKQDRKENKRAE